MSRAAVRVLAVDDAPANLTALRGRLELAFAQLDLEVVWEEAESPAAGVNQLQHFDADLLVADVMYANADDVGGLEPGLLPLMLAVDALARRPFVAAMSTHNEARSGEPERTAISLGVDLFMDRRKSIAPEAIADLARTVHDQLLANGRIHHTDVRSAPSNDPRAQAIVEEIGAAIIAELFFRALGDDALRPQQLHLAYLKPGLSGSVVCRVDAQDEAGHSVHVMKLSRDASLLAKELTRGRVLGQQVQRCFVPHTSTSVTRPLAGWNAILLPLADRAVTLREWLSHGPAADAVDSVLEVLFVEGLGPMYQRRVQPAVATIGQVLSLGGYRANLVASAMADLAPALVKMLGADMTKNLTTGLAAFVRRGIVLDMCTATCT
jgi:CheY-like chemotaxis protein